MTTTTICLVRHGETDWNAQGRIQGQEDTPLNDTGRVQAHHAGRHLAQWPWDLIVASPLARALDTARHIACATGLKVGQTLPELMERDYGAASGYTPAENELRFPTGEIPGLETRSALQARIMAGLTRLAYEYPGRRIIAVSHGGAINAALAHISQGRIGSGKTQLANACISLVHHRAGAWEIEYYNYQDHLTAHLDRPATTHISVG